MSSWRLFSLDHELGSHAAAWDALCSARFSEHPLLASGFVEGLLRHFGDGTEVLCVKGKGEVPEAMCILKRQRFGIWQTFLPSQAQIGPLLLNKQEDVTDLIQSLPKPVYRLDLLCCDPNFNDPCQKASSTLPDRQRHALTMCIALNESFEDYWAKRSRKLVQNLGRYERRLEADGHTSKFRCITDNSEIRSAVRRYADLESKGWKGKLGTALNHESSQGIFYNNLMEQTGSKNQAAVYELWLDEKLVASRLVINSVNMVVTLKTTYDENYTKYAPGRLLLKYVLIHLFQNHQGKIIEFYTDANQDQLTWATGQRWINNFSIYHHGFYENIF